MTAPAATHPAPDTAPVRHTDAATTASTRFDADVLAAVRNAS
jgi:hypothetical protein